MRHFIRSSGLVTFISFMLVFGATEVGVRHIRASLPVDPGKWPRVEIAQKLDRLDREVKRGRPPEVVFVGSSVMAGGVDPVHFTKASGVPSYNAAWAGATGRTSRLWTVDVIEPLAGPNVVVLGVQSGELNDNGGKNRSIYRKFVDSPGYEQTVSSLPRRIEGRIEKLSDLIRYRLAFRKPTVLFERDRAALRAAEVRKEVGPRGRRVEEPVTYRFRNKFAEQFPRLNLTDLSHGGHEYEAVVKMHDELAERGVKFVLMATPVTEDYYSVHPDPEGDKLAFDRMIARYHRETGGTVIDAADAFPSSSPFRDPVHLDLEGRRAMSVALAESWDRIARPAGTWFRVSCGGADEAPQCEVKARR